MKGKQHFVLIFIVFLSFFIIGAPTVFAHSSVAQETPSPNSQLETSPTEIVIVFNDKIERELISLKVFDEKQQEVTRNKAQINDGQLEIRLALPDLVDGVYHVQYHAISSNDGHPVKGSYRFRIATTTPVNQIIDDKDLCIPNDCQQSPHILQDADSAPTQQETPPFYDRDGTEWIVYFMRVIYYIGLLLVVGWIFWWRIVQDYSTELKKKYLAYGMTIQILHLTGLISMILMQLNILTNFGLDFSSDFLIDSTFGLMWLLSLVISLIGFACLFRNKWFDLIWIVFILISKSLNGHSFEFEPTSVLVLTNSAHLLAASIWAAGLLFILGFWRKQRLFVYSFIPSFSKYAFWSIVVLSITGLFATISFLSGTPLLLNPWILILLFKLIAVIGVILTGGIIRSKLKKQHTMNLNLWIKLDFFLMLIIVILVSIFTYLNPLP